MHFLVTLNLNNGGSSKLLRSLIEHDDRQEAGTLAIEAHANSDPDELNWESDWCATDFSNGDEISVYHIKTVEPEDLRVLQAYL